MKYLRPIHFLLIVFCLVIASCASVISENEKTPFAETVFEASLPEELESEAVIYLEIIDEVTGVSLNPKRYAMQPKDNLSVFVRIPLGEGSMIHYRYIKHTGSDLIESNLNGNRVYYRTHIVDHPAVINDKVTNWSNEAIIIANGDISGFIYDEKTNLPLAGIKISINGSTGITLSDGSYQIKNIPVGEYDLVAYHPDDLYKPFQQGAIIAENAVTPASFGMNLAKIVEITFDVEVPSNTGEGIPVKFLGDNASLGNIFSESNHGASILASRAHTMDYLGDRKYTLTLELPAESDLRYKYSLGDGFINAEISEDGVFLTRQLIVPGKNTTVKNQVAKWSSVNNEPITFQVTVPEITPSNETVSIQFNPFTWMQPIQMWTSGHNQWSYLLYGPLEYMDNSQFRFCRNDLCGLTDDLATSGINGNGYLLKTSELNQNREITYNIQEWANLSAPQFQFEKNSQIVNKPTFFKGIQFTNKYDPAWLPYIDDGFIDAAVSGANWIILPTTRTIKSNNLPSIEYESSSNISDNDLTVLYNYAQSAGLNPILYPQIASNQSSIDSFWNTATISSAWWEEWFLQYERFVLDFSKIAEKNDFPVLIIGGNSVAPALPSGQLPNGNLSNTPYDYPDKWKMLFENIRSIYSGQLIFAIPSESSDHIEDSIFENVDAFLIETDVALTDDLSPTIDNLRERFGQELDSSMYKMVEKYQKPIIIGINYASIDGSASNCVFSGSTCAELLNTSQNYSIDLAEQADVYRAILDEIIKRDWITGAVSQGYFPAAVVRDASSSVRGKPAIDVLYYFFNEVIR